MPFTTWGALKTQMLDDMTNRSWRVKTYEMDGQTTEYTSFTEFKKALDYVCLMAEQEAGTYSSRTYARSGGRF